MLTRIVRRNAFISYLVVCITLCAVFLLQPINPISASEKIYRFSVVPQQSPSKTARLWGPVITYLEEVTGEKFRLSISGSIPKFENELAFGHDDFSYMNPYHYIEFHASQGYQAIARAKDRKLKGIIIVHKDSSLRELAELNGKTMVFPAPAAFAATLLPREALQQKNISYEHAFAGSHDAVYLNVVRGRYSAGGGIIRTLNNMPKSIRENLKILWQSESYTSHAIAAHPAVPAELVIAVQQALQDLDKTEQGRHILSLINIKGWIKADDTDWDDVRRLQLNPLYR